MCADRTTLIQRSTAFTSLQAKQKIHTVLADLAWKSVHGFCYQDHTTRQLRTGDIFASKLWETHHGTAVCSAVLNLCVEVHSIKGYHLLFSKPPDHAVPFDERLPCEGIHSEELGMRDLLFDALNTSLLTSEQSRQVMLNWMNVFINEDDELFTKHLHVKPFPVPDTFSSFQEVDSDEKHDGDTSILWSTIQSLYTMYINICTQSLKSIVYDIPGQVEFALQEGYDPVEHILESFEGYARSVHLFHPIVVLDADMWGIDRTIKEIDVCRFFQVDHHGNTRWWVDVVNTSHFDAYARTLDSYYTDAFCTIKTERLRMSEDRCAPHPRHSAVKRMAELHGQARHR